MSTPLIALRGVSREYAVGTQRVRALVDVDLTIERGEFVAIVGASGSGKSTLMNLLGCLDRPSAGHYLLDGNDTAGLDADELARIRRETFGFIFQRYNLLPHQDAIENVALPAIYAGVPADERARRAGTLLERLGLGDRLRHKPTELSGGQQQRVSIARALMNGGQVLLADEPTGALDSQSGAEMLRILQALNRQGHTVIVVTHDARGLAASAQRIVEISDGRIVADRRNEAVSSSPDAAIAPVSAADAEPLFAWDDAASAARVTRLLPAWRQAVGRAREALRSAIQAIFGHRLRSVLSLIGVCIGITAVVVVVTLSGAVQHSIDNEVGALFDSSIKVWTGNPRLPPGSQPQPFSASDLDAVRGLDGVKTVQIQMKSDMAARQGAKDARVKVHGAQSSTLQVNRLSIVQGRTFVPVELDNGAQVVVIDHKIREALFRPGERVIGRTIFLSAETVESSPTAEAGMSGIASDPAPPSPALLPFTVIGLFEPASGSNFGRESTGELLIPHSAFAAKLDTRFETREFTVVITDPEQAENLRRRITERLKSLHGAEDFETWNAASDINALREVMGVLALVLGLVAAIALLVGGIGIMNIMLVSVTERTREIGIRMAIGARQSDIRSQFLVESVLLCGAGGVISLVLCAVAALIANAAQSRMRLEVDLAALVAAFTVSALVGILSGTWPAKRAAALSPVEALSRE
ncbi:MAG: ATP-binding cassette domain-containing protein [Lysobacter sp.]|nr:ATP-binding cassette domain-containing protein [Lysobacter sp.]